MRERGGFHALDEVVCTVMIHPEAKSTKFIKRQIVEHLAVCHRMGLHEAAEWRLDHYADQRVIEALQDLRTHGNADQVLAQYSWKEMLRHLVARKRSGDTGEGDA